MSNSGKLILVPTPIGNLGDITFRAVSVLKEADIILAEDTRISSRLLHHLEIDKKLWVHHKFNEHKAVGSLVAKIQEGNKIAMITDAGTPGISDPGFLLVRACIENEVEVECLPGPTALIPALAVSGLPTDRFVFEGFLPQKKGRQTRLVQLAEEPRTMVFYESPFRLVKALSQFAEYFGSDRKCCVCRELSKMFEEIKRGTVNELQQYYTAHPPKGEIVIVVEGNSKDEKKGGKYAADEDE
jgi:16S rRNA (cytidine1402-2'-O)-methyltransferase